MKTEDFEIFRKISYKPFENNGKIFQLSNYPYLDIVFNDHCNAKCKFCIAKLVHKKEWATLDLHKKNIDYAIWELGVKEVLLLGGEPTINDGMFEYINYLKNLPVNKICTTTNGHRMSADYGYAEKLFSSGITHINISLMNLVPEKQKNISGTDIYIGIGHLKKFKELADFYNVKIRINNNVFRENNDSLPEIIKFYEAVAPFCHSVKFSPLLKTDSFSTVNEVTEFNHTHLLSDQEYDDLWHEVESFYSGYPIVRNKETFGFVEYSQILKNTPIIFNYNQHGQLRNKVINEGKINNLKLLPTGDLSLSWNREEKNFFINTELYKNIAIYPCDF